MIGEEKFTILVVDDEKNNIVALAHILMSMYTVLAAKDGLTAIELAETKSPDLILLDILMPGMSGFDALVKLKDSELTRDIPVIFITGLDSREDEETGLLLGAVDYITKPFHDSIVKLRVETHLKILTQMRTIERLGMIDTLTNIPNRRCYDNQLSVEWNRAVRNNAALSILMIDIDDFKQFNDAYGHMHGDKVLQAVASVIEKTLKRPADFVARWGGEEFSVLLPETDLEGVLFIAEQIRLNVENTSITHQSGLKSKITVSIGASHRFPSLTDSIDLFISLADYALYAAKAAGKNIVMRWDQC